MYVVTVRTCLGLIFRVVSDVVSYNREVNKSSV